MNHYRFYNFDHRSAGVPVGTAPVNGAIESDDRNVIIINDPTNSGRGKVFSIRYGPSSDTAPTS